MPALNKSSGKGSDSVKVKSSGKKSKQKDEKRKKTEKTSGKKAKSKKVVEENVSEEIKTVVSFTDGLVSSQFCSNLVPSWPPKSEVDLLSSCLKYFSVTVPFMGNMSAKMSFMKKKGGRLL